MYYVLIDIPRCLRPWSHSLSICSNWLYTPTCANLIKVEFDIVWPTQPHLPSRFSQETSSYGSFCATCPHLKNATTKLNPLKMKWYSNPTDNRQPTTEKFNSQSPTSTATNILTNCVSHDSHITPHITRHDSCPLNKLVINLPVKSNFNIMTTHIQAIS